MSELISQGLRRAKLMGKQIGGSKPKYDKAVVELMMNLKGKKISITEIARRLDIPRETVRDAIKREICKSLK